MAITWGCGLAGPETVARAFITHGPVRKCRTTEGHVLVLTRKLGESITIGDDIRVSILGVQGRQVRLGIAAPADVAVHREEIYSRVQDENRRAAGSGGSGLRAVINLIREKLGGEQAAGADKPDVETTDVRRNVKRSHKRS